MSVEAARERRTHRVELKERLGELRQELVLDEELDADRARDEHRHDLAPEVDPLVGELREEGRVGEESAQGPSGTCDDERERRAHRVLGQVAEA